MKLKRFALHWEATVRGIQYVEAFDEEDAREQFDCRINEDCMPDEPIQADIEDVVEVKKKKRSPSGKLP